MQKNMFGQTKVWMVWRKVGEWETWLEGVFAGKRTANEAMAQMFDEWLEERKMTADEWQAKKDNDKWGELEDPFFVSSEVVQHSVKNKKGA